MSLKEKILEQAKTADEIRQWVYEPLEWRTAPLNTTFDGPYDRKLSETRAEIRWVSVDDVSGLLDKAIADIDAKAFRQGVAYWENAVMLEDVRKILLGVGEGKQK